jgi:uncharacterized protein
MKKSFLILILFGSSFNALADLNLGGAIKQIVHKEREKHCPPCVEKDCPELTCPPCVQKPCIQKITSCPECIQKITSCPECIQKITSCPECIQKITSCPECPKCPVVTPGGTVVPPKVTPPPPPPGGKPGGPPPPPPPGGKPGGPPPPPGGLPSAGGWKEQQKGIKLKPALAKEYTDVVEKFITADADKEIWIEGKVDPETEKDAMSEALANFIKEKAIKVDLSKNTEGNNLLLMLAQADDAELLKAFLTKGFNNIKIDLITKGKEEWVNDKGDTALILAAQASHAGVVEVLLAPDFKEQVKVNAQNKVGFTPLMYAAENSSYKMAEMLLERGAIESIKNKAGKTAFDLATDAALKRVLKKDTALMEFIRDNDFYKIKKVFKLGSIPAKKLNQINAVGQTALTISIEMGYQDIFDWLMKQKYISVVTKNADGLTPIMFAAEKANLHMIKALLAKAASGTPPQSLLDEKNKDGKVAYELLPEGSSEELRNLLLGETPLIKAVTRDDLVQVQNLLKDNITVNKNAVDLNGYSALMLAVVNKKEAMVEALADAKAGLNIQNALGYTALMYAAENGNVSAVKALIEAKASKILKNVNGKTAAVLAANSKLSQDVKKEIAKIIAGSKGSGGGDTVSPDANAAMIIINKFQKSIRVDLSMFGDCATVACIKEKLPEAKSFKGNVNQVEKELNTYSELILKVFDFATFMKGYPKSGLAVLKTTNKEKKGLQSLEGVVNSGIEYIAKIYNDKNLKLLPGLKSFIDKRIAIIKSVLGVK